MVRLLIVISTVLSAGSLRAMDNPTNTVEALSGLLQRNDKGMHFLKLPEGSYRIVSSNREIEEDLLRMQVGDYVVAQGYTHKESVVLQSIELVGLRKLLGVWGTSDWNPKVYNFESFSKLIVQNDAFFSSPMNENGQAFSYHITPSFGESWTVFLYSEVTGASYSGTLVIHERQIKLNFVDRVSGMVVHRLKLKRLSP